MMARLSRVGGGLTASRFAEHPVGEPPGQPRLVSRRSETLGWPGSVEDPRPSGCFAKRSGGGSIELLGCHLSLSGFTNEEQVWFLL